MVSVSSLTAGRRSPLWSYRQKRTTGRRLLKIFVSAAFVTVAVFVVTTTPLHVKLVQVSLFHHALDAEELSNGAPPPPLRESTRRPRWNGFYHIYAATENNEAYNHSLRIVEEQLMQIRESYAMSTTDLRVYYTTVGHKLNSTIISSLCGPGLSCIHTGHYEKGNEELTLQKLYDHCQLNPDTGVIYLHSKGSFHPSPWNDVWRRHMTAAVTSKHCLGDAFHRKSSSSSSSCSLCGLVFMPAWAFIFPGNIWAAPCFYIRKLVPPNRFATELETVVQEALALKAKGRISTNMYRIGEQPDLLGRNRYAMEHWVASHPSVVPCDVSPSGSYRDWLRGGKTSADFNWSLAPRNSLVETWTGTDLERKRQVLADPNSRKREYYLLAGNILKWYRLYNETPPQESWVWSYFPDGNDWLRGIREYGDRVHYKIQ